MDSADILRIAVVIELYNSMHAGILSALADVDRLETAFQKLSQNANFHFSQAQKTAYNISKGAVAIGVGMTAVGLAASQSMGAFVAPAQRMQTAMTNFKIATSDTHQKVAALKAEMATLQDYAFSISAKTQFSAPQVAGFAMQLATLGFHDPRTILGTGTGPNAYAQSSLMTVAQFAEVMRATKNVDPATSVTEGGRIAGLLGWIDAKHPEKLVTGLNLLYHAALLTPAGVGQIRTTLGQMASIPNSMLSSQDRLEIAAFSGRMSAGRQGNQIAAAFQKLVPAMFGRGSKGELQALYATGLLEKDKKGKVKLDYFNDKGQFIGWDKFLHLLQDKFKKFSPIQQSALIQGFQGTTGAKALVPYLQGNVLADYEQMLRDQAKMESLTQAQSDLFNTYTGQLNNVKTNWENVRTLLGDPIQTALTHIYATVADILSKVTAWLELHPQIASWLGKILLAFTGISLVVGPLLIFFGTLGIAVTAVSGLVAAFGGLSTIIGALVTPLAAVAGAIMLIVLGWRAWSSAGSFGVSKTMGSLPKAPTSVPIAGVHVPIALPAKVALKGGPAVRDAITSLVHTHLNALRQGHMLPAEVTRELDIMGKLAPKPTRSPGIKSYDEYIADLVKKERKIPGGNAVIDYYSRLHGMGGKGVDEYLGKPYADYLGNASGATKKYQNALAKFEASVKDKALIEQLRTRLITRASAMPTGDIKHQLAQDTELRQFIKDNFPASMEAQLNSLADRVPYATKRAMRLLPVRFPTAGDALKGIARGLSPINTPREMYAHGKEALKTAADLKQPLIDARNFFDVFKNGLPFIDRVVAAFRAFASPLRMIVGLGRMVWDVLKIPIDPVQLVLFALQGLAQAVFKNMAAIKATFSGAWNEIARQVRVALATMQTQFEAIFGKGSSGKLIGYVQGFFDLFQKLADTFERVFEGMWPGIATQFKGFWMILEGIITAAWAVIKGLLQVGHDLFTGHFNKIGADLTDIWTGIWRGLGLELQGAYAIFIAGPMESLAGALEAVFGGIFTAIEQKVVSFLRTLGSIPGIGGQFTSWANDLQRRITTGKAGSAPSSTPSASAALTGGTARAAAQTQRALAIDPSKVGLPPHGALAYIAAAMTSNRFIGKGDPRYGFGAYNFPYGQGGYSQHARTMYDTDFGVPYGTPVSAPTDLKFMGRTTDSIAGLYDQFQIASGQAKGSMLMYLHMSKYTAFQTGQLVKAGQLLGYSGAPPGQLGNAHLCIVTDARGHQFIMALRGNENLSTGPTGGGIGVPKAEMPSFAQPTIHVEHVHVTGYADPQKAGADFVKAAQKAARDAYMYGPAKGATMHMPRVS